MKVFRINQELLLFFLFFQEISNYSFSQKLRSTVSNKEIVK